MNNRGAGLTLALLSVLVMALMGAAVYALTRALARESVYVKRSAQAQAIAEAGVEDAMLQLLLNRNWRTGFTNKPFAGGSYTVTLSTDLTNPWVFSTGYSVPIPSLRGPAVRTVTARAILTAGFANYSKSSFTVSGIVDSYDYRVNADPKTFGSQAEVWSDSNVVTSGGTTRIFGNVKYIWPPAPGLVSGTVIQATNTKNIAILDGSPYLAANDNATCCNPQTIYDAATMKILVPTATNATIAPGVYYFKGMDIFGRLRADTDKNNDLSVTIYLEGNLNVSSNDKNKGLENKDKKPALFLINGQGGYSFVFAALKNPLHALIHAPEDHIRNDQEIYGKILGKSVNITTNAKLHFDISNFSPEEAKGTRWVSGSWALSYDRQ